MGRDTSIDPGASVAQEYATSASAVGQVIGFITEFNQNARIFNEILAPALQQLGLQVTTNTFDVVHIALAVALLEARVNGMEFQLGLSNGADSENVNRAPGGGWR